MLLPFRDDSCLIEVVEVMNRERVALPVHHLYHFY
jgi:hypothetical protein